MILSKSENIFSAGAIKLTSFAQELKDWNHYKPFVPLTLEIHSTEICNHRCPNCQGLYTISSDETNFRTRKYMHLDLDLLESVWEMPPKGIVISGNTGEPLLHPDIARLLTTLGEKKLPAVLITNGEALTGNLASLAVRVCRGIRISLDADNPDLFKCTHGVKMDSWQRVLHSIHLLIEARQQSQRSAADCLIGIGYLTDELTRDGMIPATQLARSLGVDYIQFRPFHYSFTDINKEFRECQKFESNNFKVFASDQKYRLFGNLSRYYSHCHGAHFYTVLDARGDFYICCHHVRNLDARLGSLNTQSWHDFVISAHRRQRIANFDLSQCVPLCRLHTHNELLELMKEKEPIVSYQNINLPSLIHYHMPFL